MSGTGMKTSYDASGSLEERQAAAKASLEALVPIPTVEIPEEVEEVVITDRDGYIEKARKLEIQLLRGLRMARSAAFQLSDLSVDAAIELAVLGESNPIQSILGVGEGTGLPEGKHLLAQIFERTAARIVRDGDFDAETLKAP